MNGTMRFLTPSGIQTLDAVDPGRTVLEYLREDVGLTGTKEGCAEGDCGSCTVVLGELYQGRVLYRPVNACILFLPVLDGKYLLTVENLRGADGRLHPVQQAMVDHHGSQCGFCTPGFVMALYALYQDNPRPDRQRVCDALAGNLCRCTGYRPIIDAALQMADYPVTAIPGPDEDAIAATLAGLQRQQGLAIHHGERRFFAPRTLTELAELLHQYPDAHRLAGGTDVGLWVTKQHQDLHTVVYLGDVAELHHLHEADGWLTIGATVPYADAHATIARHYPDFGELLRRLGSEQIRHRGTIGGNIANASPIGDTPPALIALGAQLVLGSQAGEREMPLEDFFLDYRRTALGPEEFVQAIRLPLPQDQQQFRCYKIAKRFDQDISAVCGAFWLRMDGDRIVAARIAFGGMAATPQRASHCEAALVAQPWSEATMTNAAGRLAEDFMPLSDMRASRDYRLQVAINLLRKCWLETTTTAPLRVVG